MSDLVKILGIVFSEAWKSCRKTVLWIFIFTWVIGWGFAPYYGNIRWSVALLGMVSPAAYFVLKFWLTIIFICCRNTSRFFYALRVMRCYELLVFIAVCEKFNRDTIQTFMATTTDTWRTLSSYPYSVLAIFVNRDGLYDAGWELSEEMRECSKVKDIDQDDPRFTSLNAIYRRILSNKKKYFAIAKHLPASDSRFILKTITELKSNPEKNCIDFHLTVSDEELEAAIAELLPYLKRNIRCAESQVDMQIDLMQKLDRELT